MPHIDIPGHIDFDVAGCKLLEPESTFDLNKDRFAWIKDLDAVGRNAL